jgi:hypothetical protein
VVFAHVGYACSGGKMPEMSRGRHQARIDAREFNPYWSAKAG